MTKKEIVKEIFLQVENLHCNLYHKISKEAFNKKLSEFLEVSNSLDDVHFDAGILKLFALFGDAHTVYDVPAQCVRKCIKFINGKFYYYNSREHICEEIKQVNGNDLDIVVGKLKQLIPYEVESWANYKVTKYIRAINYLQMIDCENKINPNQIEFELLDGRFFTEVYENNKYKSSKPYSFELLNDILKIEYKECRDMEGYPFVDFVEDIKKAIKEMPQACLIDLRNNGGGSSEVIQPLLRWLKDNNIKTYALMNEGVFSGGVFALIDLKAKLNATFIGTEAGQEGHSYGNGKWHEVAGKFFKASKNYINQTTIDTKQNVKEIPIDKTIGYLGAIQPDIYLEEKIEDVAVGIDGQLRDCLEIIEKDLEISKENFIIK